MRQTTMLLAIASGVGLLTVGGCAHSSPATVAGPATRPATLRFGSGGNRLTIAFVCDASASMAPKMVLLRRELAKAIEGLHPYQEFSIVFMREKGADALDPKLLLATPENKRRAEAFLADEKAGGTTDPIPALELAMGQHPQLVYILTDRDFPDDGKLLDEIRGLDPGHKVKINTIAFVNGPGDHDPNLRQVLTQIAKESGGTFKQVDYTTLDSTQPATAPATRP